MKNLLVCIFFIPHLVLGQKVDLSGYKYVFIKPLNHRVIDASYGITSSIASAFTAKGLMVANHFTANEIPQDLKNNACLLLTVTPRFSSGTMSVSLSIDVQNCDNVTVLSTDVVESGSRAYEKAINGITKSIDRTTYFFNSSLTPLPRADFDLNYNLPNTGLTEDSVRKYLDNTKLDQVEGIYKSYRQAEDISPSYKFAVIKKSSGQYQAVILESETPVWKTGEIKMILENTAINDIFSARYYMHDKTKVETFASFGNNTIKIDFANATKNKENSIATFVKTYPFNTSPNPGNIPIGGSGNTLVGTGTGFIISEKGFIVTNYHVIASGNRFTATNTDSEKTYELELIQKDKTNDLAILRIKNLEQPLPHIPYALSSKGKTGQSVFTIGYPLNDVMGNNQKVTNGIISALTGIQDDSRYYQVSVPIQPGNSGGALFDLKGGLIGITSSTLNPEAVKTNVQNVNYAIKVNLLQNLIAMLPEEDQIPVTTSEQSNELPISLLSDKYKTFVFKISTYK
ncbi:S1C family serine protease [Chitinophagaceae bacterium 26-R-25]|nr:S1C family serine protease [Chitinophagaceae bacterium 26-R-25]